MMSTLQAARVSRWQLAWAVAFVIAATVAVYQPILSSYYLADDFALFSRPSQRSWLLSHAGYIRPLPHLAMRLDFQFQRFETTVAHTSNLLWHLASVYLVSRLSLRITGSRRVAFAAALLFALHPIHPPAVSWLSARFDLMCTTFMLGCAVLFDRSLESGKQRHAVFAMLCFVAALLSKELAITTPALLVGVAWMREGRVRWKPLVPFAVLLLLYFGLRIYLFGGIGGRIDESGASLQLNTSPATFLRGLILYPSRGLLFPVNQLQWAGASHWLEGILLLLATTALVFGVRAPSSIGRRALLFGVGLFFVGTLPISTWNDRSFEVGLANARMFYLPSAGFCIALAGLLVAAPQRLGSGLLVGLTLLYGGITYGNNLPWCEAAEIAESVPRQIAELLPPEEGTHSWLIAEGFPTHHRGANLFLGRALEFSLGLVTLNKPRQIVNKKLNYASTRDLRSLGKPNRIFGVRFDEVSGQVVDCTASVRRELEANAAAKARPVSWNAREIASWALHGAQEPLVVGNAFVVHSIGRPILLECAPLPRTSRLLELLFTGEGSQPDPRAPMRVSLTWSFGLRPSTVTCKLKFDQGSEELRAEFPIVLMFMQELEAQSISAKLTIRNAPETLRIHSIRVRP